MLSTKVVPFGGCIVPAASYVESSCSRWWLVRHDVQSEMPIVVDSLSETVPMLFSIGY